MPIPVKEDALLARPRLNGIGGQEPGKSATRGTADSGEPHAEVRRGTTSADEQALVAAGPSESSARPPSDVSGMPPDSAAVSEQSAQARECSRGRTAVSFEDDEVLDEAAMLPTKSSGGVGPKRVRRRNRHDRSRFSSGGTNNIRTRYRARTGTDGDSPTNSCTEEVEDGVGLKAAGLAVVGARRASKGKIRAKSRDLGTRLAASTADSSTSELPEGRIRRKTSDTPRSRGGRPASCSATFALEPAADQVIVSSHSKDSTELQEQEQIELSVEEESRERTHTFEEDLTPDDY